MAFKAFISYSHSADGKLAPAVQGALRSIAKPWYRLRTMHVFRDQTNLGASPGLWSSILAALEQSEFFLFMASPTAAQSPWVQKEVDWWLTHRSSESFLILLTEGDIVWDEGQRDFDWAATTALPNRISNAFREEPLYTELRWARTSNQLSLRHSQFRAAILELAATLLHRPKDELDGEDVRQFRRTRRIAWSGVVILAALLVAATVAAYVATQQRDLAISRALGASAEASLFTNPELALLLAEEAVRVKEDDQARFALREAMARNPQRTLHHARPGRSVIAEFAGGSDFIIAAEPGSRAALWNATDGRRVLDLPVEVGDELMLSSSPDGTAVALDSGKGNFVLYDTKGWKTVAELPGTGPQFSRQATWLAATAGGEIRQWNFPSLQERRPSIRLPGGYALREISSDGSLLFAADGDWSGPSAGLVLAADTGATVARMPPGRRFPGAIFSPDGRLVLAMTNEDILEFWDTRTGSRSQTLKGYAGWVEQAAFSPDGKTLVTGSRDGIIRIWAVATGESEGELRLHSNRVSRAQFSRDGAVILSASVDGTACLWSVESRRCLVELGGKGDDIWDARFAADGIHFLTTHLDGTVRIWSRERWYPSLSFDAANAVISANGRSVLAWSAEQPAQLWDVPSGRSKASLERSGGQVKSVALSPDGTVAAIAPSKGVVQMWNALTGKEMLRLGKPTAEATALAFSRDAKQLAIGGSRGNIQFWSTQDGSSIKEWPGSGAPVTKLLFSPDGATVVVTAASGTAQVRELKTGNVLQEIKASGDDGAPAQLALDLALNAKGHPLLLIAREKIVQIGDVSTGTKLKTLAGHSDEVLSGAFSSDGLYVVTGSGYQMASGEAPDDGNEVRVWDAKTGRELIRYRAASMAVQHVAFGSDAKTVIAASSEGVVRVYRCDVCLALPELIALSSRYRGLTTEERTRYVPDSNLLHLVFRRNTN